MKWINLSSSTLSEALQKSAFSCAEKGNPKWGALNAVCLLFEKDNLSVIGTDQHRASIVTVPLPGSKICQRVLVNPQSLLQATTIFQADVKIGVSDLALVLRSQAGATLIRTMGGAYPDVKKFVPKHPNKLLLPVRGFYEQLKKAYLAIDEKKAVQLDIRPNEIGLRSQTRENRREVQVSYKFGHSSPNLKVAVNAEFLVQLMKVLDADGKVEMSYKTNQEPLLFSQGSLNHVMVPLETR